MISKEQVYEKAFEAKRDRLARATAMRDAAIANLQATSPEFVEVSRQLEAIGAEIAITALSGDKDAFSALKKKMEQLSQKRKQLLELGGVKEIEYDCIVCRDTGYVGGKICGCVKELVRLYNMNELSSSLPINVCSFDNFSLDYYPDEDINGANPKKRMSGIYKLCRDYVDNFDPKLSENLLFMGAAGLGKTHLSLAIVSELTKRGYHVIYGSAHNLFSAMEDDRFVRHTSDNYEAAVECDLLVIDDLGSEFVSPYIQSMLYNIVNTRLLANRPTIISTNLSIREIENLYTPRVASRFIGNYTAKMFVGKDVRQIKAMNKKG